MDPSITFTHYPKSDNKDQEIDFSDLSDGVMNSHAKGLLRRLTHDDRQFQMQEDQL